jgi:hypothetical protein
MPLTIRIETEDGASLAEVFDLQDAITELVERMPSGSLEISHTIDPYGNTVINHLQLPLLLRDLERLRGLAAAPDAVLRSVEELAARCQDDQHLYLKFYGD